MSQAKRHIAASAEFNTAVGGEVGGGGCVIQRSNQGCAQKLNVLEYIWLEQCYKSKTDFRSTKEVFRTHRTLCKSTEQGPSIGRQPNGVGLGRIGASSL